MCSWIPNPKQPMEEKLPFLSSYSLTFKPDSRISSAFGPRTVTRQAIFISSDTEGSDGESGFGEDWGLSGQLFQNFGGSGKPITTFSDENVQAKLGDSDIFHAVGFLSSGSHFSSVSST